jgi:general stress protein 26
MAMTLPLSTKSSSFLLFVQSSHGVLRLSFTLPSFAYDGEHGISKRRRRLRRIQGDGAGMSLMVLGLWFAVSVGLASMAQGANRLSAEIETALQTESYIYVATRRLSGEWSTPAAVWFMYDDGAVYFTTSPTSHKAHRIHRGSPVRIWIGRKDGPCFEGEAHFIKDRSVVERLAAGYSQKYWIAWLGFFRPRPSRVASGRTLVVKVTPTRVISTP